MSKYTKEQLIDALVNEWHYLCVDYPDDDDMTDEEYRKDLEAMSYEGVLTYVVNTADSEDITIDEYIESWTNPKAYDQSTNCKCNHDAREWH